MGCVSSTEMVGGEVKLKHFTQERVLGQGGFGKVKAVQKNVGEDKGSWYAMKMLDKEVVVKNKKEDEIFRERNLLAFVKNTFLCNSYYAFQDERYLYLIMDVALGGDLRFQLAKTKSGFSESQTKFYVAQVIIAVGYLHGEGVLHRDLKPDNFLMDKDGWVKVTDVGIADVVDEQGFSHVGSGTPGYMAPELYARPHPHSYTADWFSLGVCAFEMMTRTRPWTYEQIDNSLGSSRGQQKLPRPNQSFNSRLSDTFKSLFVNLTKHNAKKRLGAGNKKSTLGLTPQEVGLDDLRSHGWFVNDPEFSWDAIEKRTVAVPFKPNTAEVNVSDAANERDMEEAFLTKSVQEQAASCSLTPAQQLSFDGYDYDFRNPVWAHGEKNIGSQKAYGRNYGSGGKGKKNSILMRKSTGFFSRKVAAGISGSGKVRGVRRISTANAIAGSQVASSNVKRRPSVGSILFGSKSQVNDEGSSGASSRESPISNDARASQGAFLRTMLQGGSVIDAEAEAKEMRRKKGSILFDEQSSQADTQDDSDDDEHSWEGPAKDQVPS